MNNNRPEQPKKVKWLTWVWVVVASMAVGSYFHIDCPSEAPEINRSNMIEIPDKVSPEPPQPIEINLSGKGQTATESFFLSKGLARFYMKHTGNQNFIIELLDEQGNNIELLVNEIGDFDGSKATQIPNSGNYLLDISADGPWVTTIKQ